MLLSTCLITVYTPKPTETCSTYSNLRISNWFEIWKYVIFGFSENDLCKLKWLQVWSTDHINLDKACKVGTMS